MSDVPQVSLNNEPMCDHICLLPDDHVEAGRPHFYGYRLGPGSPSHSLAEVERLRAGLAVRDEALAEIALAVDIYWPAKAVPEVERILANLQRSLDPYRDDKEQQ